MSQKVASKRAPFLIAVVLVAAAIAWVVIRNRTGGTGPDAPPAIRIAGNLPLTGPIASFSGQYPRGFEMGLTEAALAAGIPRERFVTDFQDNAGRTTTAVAVMRQQLLGTPAVYVSGTSAMSDAIRGEIARRESVHVLVAFDAFMTEGRERTYRILPNFKIEAPIFVDFIKSQKPTRALFFTPNLKAYLEQSNRLIIPKLQEADIRYYRILFEPDTKDFRTLAERAAAENPDVIVLSGYAFQLYPIIRALREQGLVHRVPIIATLDFIDLIHGGAPLSDLEGIFFTAPECEIPGRVPGYAAWAERFKMRYNSTPSYVDAYAYDTARMIVKAAGGSGPLAPGALADSAPFEGIVGTIRLDEDRDLSSTLVIGYLGADGKVVDASVKESGVLK